MEKLILGLDLGITSIGWALVNVDDKNIANNKIIDSGVRIFTIAEHPKDGKSLALPRREARGARRTTKRKAQKLRAIKRLLIKNKILTQDELDNLFIGNKGQKDVWELRKEALYRELNNKELSRIMIHLAKHRGYFSNRKSEKPDKSDKEATAVLGGIEKNKDIIKNKHFLTVGEYISTKIKKRNGKDAEGKLNYENSVERYMLAEEIIIIFSKQKEFGSSLVTDELLEEYKEIAFSQRPLKSVADMVANCPFEIEEKRASKSSYTFEYFRALQKLKNLRVINEDNYEMPLIFEQIQQIVREAKKTKNFTYKSFKKLFPQYKNMKIKGLVYHDHKTGEVKEPEKVKFLDFSAFQTIKKVIQEADNLYWDGVENDSDVLDAIAKVLTTEKNDKESIKQLGEIVESEKVCEALVGISFSQFGHLSNKALKKIIPYLEDGYDYDKACDEAEYDFKAIFKGDKTKFLPPLTKQENLEMTNPVVKRAVAQMRLVYNAIARKYGEIDTVHVEFTRDIKNSHDDRRKIEKAQGEFRETKEKAREQAIDKLGKEPNAKELLKFRLWEEQGGYCIYSGNYINPHTLSDPYATEVDHILPYSRSLDDSLNNKVLCLTKENQDKGNKTPYEYIDSDKWDEFVGRIDGLKNLKYAKKNRLTKTNFDENSEIAFKERNKVDTSYISKFIKNYIESHVEFKKSKDKRHVFTMNGMLTSQLRYKWGVGDKNRDNHLHHAEDAIILAFSTQSMVKALSTVSAKREGFSYKKKEEKSKSLRFITPLDEFHKKVQESLSDIFVSHMPRRKVSGAAHSQLPYKPYCHVSKEKELAEIKKDEELKKLKKASKYRSSMKINKGVIVNGGICENEDMCRVDVFIQKGSRKYFLIPLYISDFVKEKLPNKAIVANGKPWIEMNENYDFCFSVFKNDILSVKQKNKEVALGYFVGLDSYTANIQIKEHSNIDNNSFEYKIDKKSGSKKSEYRFGLKQGVEKFAKYQVDALGNYVEVKSEKRQGTIKEGKAKRKR